MNLWNIKFKYQKSNNNEAIEESLTSLRELFQQCDNETMIIHQRVQRLWVGNDILIDVYIVYSIRVYQ